MPVTLETVVATLDQDAYRGREIIDGDWVAKTRDDEMSIAHGKFGARLIGELVAYTDAHDVGEVYMSETIFVLHVDSEGVRTLRKPDVAFVQKSRVQPLDAGYYMMAPDIAVEVISPSERPGIVQGKLRDYFTYGTQQVWLVYPLEKMIVVQHPSGQADTYRVGDRLAGGVMLPGFELDLKRLFA